MGTVQNGLYNVFRTIAEAVGLHRDVQLVLSIGNRLDPDQIGTLPSNAIVVRQAPQLELLSRASVCITHAGLNTVLEALAQGVPRVAIPITHDQPGVASRIAAKKRDWFCHFRNYPCLVSRRLLMKCLKILSIVRTLALFKRSSPRETGFRWQLISWSVLSG